MMLMMFLALVWAPISKSSQSHTQKTAEFHKQKNTEISGFISSYAIEEIEEEEEFSEEDNFTFHAAYNFISHYTALLLNKTYSSSFFNNEHQTNAESKLFIQIRCLLI
jgi:hypothetical protein